MLYEFEYWIKNCKAFSYLLQVALALSDKNYEVYKQKMTLLGNTSFKQHISPNVKMLISNPANADIFLNETAVLFRKLYEIFDLEFNLFVNYMPSEFINVVFFLSGYDINCGENYGFKPRPDYNFMSSFAEAGIVENKITSPIDYVPKFMFKKIEYINEYDNSDSDDIYYTFGIIGVICMQEVKLKNKDLLLLIKYSYLFYASGLSKDVNFTNSDFKSFHLSKNNKYNSFKLTFVRKDSTKITYGMDMFLIEYFIFRMINLHKYLYLKIEESKGLKKEEIERSLGPLYPENHFNHALMQLTFMNAIEEKQEAPKWKVNIDEDYKVKLQNSAVRRNRRSSGVSFVDTPIKGRRISLDLEDDIDAEEKNDEEENTEDVGHVMKRLKHVGHSQTRFLFPEYL